jgi:ATP-dependent Clp protease adaptor protein ClpS
MKPNTEAEKEIRDITALLPPYRVLLHNDDHNSMDHVVHSIVQAVPSVGPERAVEIMLEAHNTGVAEVIVCPLEPAELYRDRLKTFGLTASIEKA